MGRRERSRKRWWILPSAAAVGVIVSVAGLLPVFAFPLLDEPREVDAVVVLGPPMVQRLEVAQRQVDDGRASSIVISVPREWADEGAERPRLRALCGGETRYRVECITPEPFSTQGEARMVRSLMSDRDWQRVAVVTTVTHISRARLIFDRCNEPGSVLFLADQRALSPADWVREYVYQSAAFVKAWLSPGC